MLNCEIKAAVFPLWHGPPVTARKLEVSRSYFQCRIKLASSVRQSSRLQSKYQMEVDADPIRKLLRFLGEYIQYRIQNKIHRQSQTYVSCNSCSQSILHSDFSDSVMQTPSKKRRPQSSEGPSSPFEVQIISENTNMILCKLSPR